LPNLLSNVGAIVGIGFAAGAKEGMLLTIALTIELLFLSLSVAATLSDAKESRLKVWAITVAIALLLPIGATMGVVLLAGISGELLAGFFAFGLVALLYLVTEELLVEAHETPDTPFTTAIFFVGFLLLIAIEEIL
jgi:zinc transporter, ZIP family